MAGNKSKPPTGNTALGLARATGYSRDAVQARIDRFGLRPPYDGKEIFCLKPLTVEKGSATVTLEQARTRESLAKAKKIEIEIETLERKRLRVEELQTALSQSYGAMRAIIDASAMSQKEKDDCLDALLDVPKTLGWEK